MRNQKTWREEVVRDGREAHSQKRWQGQDKGRGFDTPQGYPAPLHRVYGVPEELRE